MKLVEKEEAVLILKNNGVVIYPTETFYGIGCKISNIAGIKRIFQIKKRANSMALPLIIGDLTQLWDTVIVPSNMKADVDYFTRLWPESLSLLLPAQSHISELITAGTGKVVVRQSPHMIAHFIAKSLGEPLISTSANISGKSPTAKFHEIDLNLKADGLVVEDNSQGILPSTIIEPLGNKEIKIIRQGAYNLDVFINLGFNIK